jgi:phosphoribosylaminoimidazole-succinocarboxamide synthase
MSEQKIEYEGKAKQIVPTDDPNVVIQRFKDSATAFNGKKYAEFEGKGQLNNAISSFIFQKLNEAGVATHFIERSSDVDMTVKRLDIIPLEVVVRNVVAGSLSKRTGLDEGTPMERPVIETYYKRDDLNDPLLAETHVEMLNLATREELDEVFESARKVNEVLSNIMEGADLVLVDFKLEYGRDADGNILLGDEISPDTCRLWDRETERKMDKDVFRRDLADLIEVYQEVAERLGVEV